MDVPHRPATLFPFRGVWPRAGRGVFVAPGASVIGDVTIGEDANIWFGCVVRGDSHWIKIGPRTNIQDGTIIHVARDRFPTAIGADVTVGHGARLHACTVEDRAMIGISATVLDGAMVESGAIVGAGALVPPGKRVRSGEMWAGCPAKPMRAVRPEEIALIARTATNYVELARSYLAAGIGGVGE